MQWTGRPCTKRDIEDDHMRDELNEIRRKKSLVQLRNIMRMPRMQLQKGSKVDQDELKLNFCIVVLQSTDIVMKTRETKARK